MPDLTRPKELTVIAKYNGGGSLPFELTCIKDLWIGKLVDSQQVQFSGDSLQGLLSGEAVDAWIIRF